MIEVVKDYEGFLALEEKWDALWSRAKDVTFFQTFRYNRIAWETFLQGDGRLYVITYADAGNLLRAIFPFYIDKKKRLRFINDVHSDFCTPIVDEEFEREYDLMQDVWSFLMIEKDIKFLFLDNQLASSPIISYWKTFGINAFVFSQTEHTYLKCEKSLNVIKDFKHLTSKKRSKLYNDAKKANVCELEILNPRKSLYPEKEVNALIDKMEINGLRDSHYLDERMKSFMRAIYESGLVELSILRNEGTPESIGFTFVDKGKGAEMLWVILFTNHRYNLWNNFEYLVQVSKDQQHVFDFGRGGYDYKMTNFHPYVENLYRFMYSKTRWGNWYVIWKMVASHLRKTLGKYRKG